MGCPLDAGDCQKTEEKNLISVSELFMVQMYKKSNTFES